MSDLQEKETSLLKELNKKTEEHLKRQLIQQNEEKEKECEIKMKCTMENYENKLLELENHFKGELEVKQRENEKLQNFILTLGEKYVVKSYLFLTHFLLSFFFSN